MLVIQKIVTVQLKSAYTDMLLLYDMFVLTVYYIVWQKFGNKHKF